VGEFSLLSLSANKKVSLTTERWTNAACLNSKTVTSGPCEVYWSAICRYSQALGQNVIHRVHPPR
jgi:hypothetical protein